jgi:hypothetical protein
MADKGNVGPTADDEREDGIGYCRPPVHSRYKKGESGNLDGRRGKKGKKKALKDVVRDSLNDKVSARSGTKVRRIEKKEAVAHALLNQAMAGRVSAIRELRAILQDVDQADSDATPPSELTDEDFEILKRYIERATDERKAQIE